MGLSPIPMMLGKISGVKSILKAMFVGRYGAGHSMIIGAMPAVPAAGSILTGPGAKRLDFEW